jgi:hypothetical protein
MKIHIEIFTFSDDQAHGVLVFQSHGNEAVQIPLSMPIQSYDTAVEHAVFDGQIIPNEGCLIQTTEFKDYMVI